ncbi:uncharacterized protein KY384_006495 [Bacidia gigantensis]|uniref:uncharacterized protein n=1 Tax=Bacidia gigantensis TaxID=2732470 RepID=UPI001D05B07E|nr:uncharacterized protein KY384_006495 [Bacidia gigantensis]KAG8528806.1 hypothetical protein KY384_006495 [Bacidia gigantensis]
MSATLDDDGSEDVNDFLKRVKELGDQRDREDEERNRRLEEEIIQGRKERQARREERARSLSPSKDSTAYSGTPGSGELKEKSAVMQGISRTPSLQPKPPRQDDSSDPWRRSAFDVAASDVSLESREAQEPVQETQPQVQDLSSSLPALSRNDTLSAQQRPSSRGSVTTGIRPVHSLPPPQRSGQGRALGAGFVDSSDVKDERSQITSSLASKDPTWFKQTQERGQGNAAFRRNQGEVSPKASQNTAVGLPGMSNKRYEHRTNAPMESIQLHSPTVNGSKSENSPDSGPISARSIISARGSKGIPAPIQPADSSSKNSLIASEGETLSGRINTMSPSQGQLLPEVRERSVSPTKGLGGFVQSALMKRSDSVSKRWSAQATPGLSRGNSIASNRSEFERPRFQSGGLASLGEPKPARFNRESLPVSSTSGSNSSHINSTPISRKSEGIQDVSSKSAATVEQTTPADSTTYLPSLAESQAGLILTDAKDETAISPPASPSKRWSPQKSSWLENAINKPESPKVLSQSPTKQQPPWMADLARAKQQGSIDLSRNTPHKQVNPGGLMRSPPPGAGYKAPNIGGLPPGFTASFTTRPKIENSEDPSKIQVSGALTADDEAASTPSITSAASQTSTSQDAAPKLTKESFLDEPSLRTQAIVAGDATPPSFTVKPTNLKPKARTPPKKDFQPALKSRSTPQESKDQEVPEFKNIFGKLKPAQVGKYKAPDELKDNITRGKANLAFTGGPKKTEHKDNFKESILRKKQGMITPSASTIISSAATRDNAIQEPEAIQKRQGLMRSENVDIRTTTQSSSNAVNQQSEIIATGPQWPNMPKPASTKKPTVNSPVGKSQTNVPNAANFASSLAGILQRGAPQPFSKEVTVGAGAEIPVSTSNEASIKLERGPQSRSQLTHATKARARGPKRKPPSSSKQDSSSLGNCAKDSAESVLFGSGNPADAKETPTVKHDFLQRPKPEPRPLSNITKSNNNNRKPSLPSSPRKPSTSVALSAQSSPTAQSPSALKSPNQALETSANSHPSALPKSMKKRTASEDNARSPETEVLRKSSNVLKSPPAVAQKPAATKVIAMPSDQIQSRSPVIPTRPENDSKTSELFANIFDDTTPGKVNIRVNTQEVIDARQSKESFQKIKTLRKQIFQILDNGKTIPVPQLQEHVLFEDALYLCNHVFGTATGQRMTEVYLWCGDGMSSSLVEDAQIFAKKFARDSNGKLVIIAQGKETSNFFQALGGIVIVRRGPSRHIDQSSDSAYILCGRQHAGQMAFDEILLTPQSLCSGFPFIVSTGSGKIFLWKGEGSSADEIGCARLIGMDLGISGDIMEVSEGSESADFWSAFASTPQTATTPDPSFQHWREKSVRETYSTRLFGSEIDWSRPKSASSFMQWGRRPSTPSNDTNVPLIARVREIAPYSQADVLGDGVVILDAYFEIFIIHSLATLAPPPHRRTSNLSSFRAALLFAQEYAILVASAEDRPFVPQGSVVFFAQDDASLEDQVPQMLIWSFRKWDAHKVKACKVLGLVEALEAIGMSRDA